MELTGVVEEIIFSNKDNGYTVCVIDHNDEPVVAVGIMPLTVPGENVRLFGDWARHPEYGRQFKVTLCEKVLPSTLKMIERYLGSGIIKGIGPSTAEKIVARFGEKTFEIMENESSRLSEIKGISKKKAAEMGESFLKQIAMRQTIMFLQQFGVTPNLCMKIYRRFGNDAVRKIKENPYILSDHVEGVGFHTADKIAEKMGIDPHDSFRLEAAAIYLLQTAAGSGGHTCLPHDTLLEEISRLTGASREEAEASVEALLLSRRVVREARKAGDFYALDLYFRAENVIARRLTNLSMDEDPLFSTESGEIEGAERRLHLTLADKQREAVALALKHHAAIITGGPGTGKTTIIKVIIDLFHNRSMKVLLAAPTGRAAKRMTEMTGHEAATIHRLLEMSRTDENAPDAFGRDEGNPLECHVLIVDEMSMMDTLLMQALLKALTWDTRLIMVGDQDQLPSVGAGNVLHDLLKSGVLPSVRLTEIYRQAEESMIVQNAHRINRGDMPAWNEKDTDFFFLPRRTQAEGAETVVSLVRDRLPKFLGEKAPDIQILTPTRKGPLGVLSLNETLQAALNPPSPEKEELVAGSVTFREGDRVMQTKNNYNIVWVKNDETRETGSGIYNGELGEIVQINPIQKKVSVLFDGERMVRYAPEELEELEHAWAMTVHKSQGSEFDAVVLPLFPGAPPLLMTRNILYTAVTRAKRLVVLLGSAESLREMIENQNRRIRYTGLLEKLQKCARL